MVTHMGDVVAHVGDVVAHVGEVVSHSKKICWVIVRGRQRYRKNVRALYVITFGLFSECNFKKR
jgi:hypothetical protein